MTADYPFLYPSAGHVETGDLSCIHDKGLRPLFKKGPKYRLPSRIDFTKNRSIVEVALQSYCKRWCKKESVGVHALNDWKNEFLRMTDIRIENFTKHAHLFKQPGLSQISFFLSLFQHLFPAAVWNIVTRFPASGCFKCHYSSHSSSDLVVWWIPLYNGVLCSRVPDLQYGLLDFKHRSPRVLLIPLRLPSVPTLHLPGVSCKRLSVIPKQNRSTEGSSKLKRSVDMTSSWKNGLNITTNASPKWDRTRCQEE